MFSLFKRRSDSPEEPTFKTRIRRFWDWYAQVAPRFYKTIEDGQCASLVSEVSSKVDELIPGFAWVFGPGEGGKGHSFTLSGEGNIHRQLLTIFWLSHAPKLDGWSFYASRQPGSIQGIRMRIGERDFDPIEFWLTPSIDRESQKVDLTIWHPLLKCIEERARWTTLFLFLDEVLGEYGTHQWIGEINLNDEQLSNAIPLQELPGFLKRMEADTGWKHLPPGEAATSYHSKDPQDRFLRDDVIAGSTMNWPLVRDYIKAEGNLNDPLGGTGANYVFVAFPADFLPDGMWVEARGAIEDSLDNALRSASSGRLLGGSHGRRFAYIDLLLFDGIKSLEIVKQVLGEKKLPAGTAIHFFAKEKSGQQIVL